MSFQPRLIRPVPDQLGLYFRAGRNDHKGLLHLLAEQQNKMSGLVFDPLSAGRHKELREAVTKHRLEAVLDPMTMVLATPGGFTEKRASEIRWAGKEMHTPDRLRANHGLRLVDAIASYVVDHGFSAVIAPAHYIEGPEDPWFEIDCRLTRRLRNQLDSSGRRDASIYYPLAIHAHTLANVDKRQALKEALMTLPVDAVWLRIHPFGSSSGPYALRAYIEACQDLQKLRIPIIAERTGTVGLALLSFGAVGGIESGITFGERFEMTRLIKPQSNNKPFLPPPRVYIPAIGAFLERKQAEQLFSNRQMKTLFGCQGECCERGAPDMLANPKRHFLITRIREVSKIGNLPEALRPRIYLDEFLRPATDLAIKAADIEPSLMSTRKKLESWRVMLSSMLQTKQNLVFGIAPKKRRHDQSPGAYA